MSSTANTIPNEFEMSGASSIEEWRLFDGIVRKHTDLPDGVHRIGFRCDLDSTGEPAIWIVFVADDDLHPSDEKLAAIKRLGDQIRSEILQSGSERWPFTRIEVE
jgi:hypothetical protein